MTTCSKCTPKPLLSLNSSVPILHKRRPGTNSQTARIETIDFDCNTPITTHSGLRPAGTGLHNMKSCVTIQNMLYSNLHWRYDVMITFDDVRRTDKQTFLFIPDNLHDEFEYFLRAAGISEQDAKVLTYQKTLATYPSLNVPTVPMHPDLAGKPDINPVLLCDTPSLITSRMDTDDLGQELWQLHASPDGITWRAERTRRNMEAAEKEANETETRNTNLPDDFFRED